MCLVSSVCSRAAEAYVHEQSNHILLYGNASGTLKGPLPPAAVTMGTKVLNRTNVFMLVSIQIMIKTESAEDSRNVCLRM